VSTDIRKVAAQKTGSLFHQNKITPLHIAIAPTKSNDRMEWFLEKATEIGVTQITPILCQHSERKTIKPDRMKKFLVGGIKQSAQFYLPKLNPLLSFEDFISLSNHDVKLLAHCQKSIKKDLSLIENLDGNLLIVIGPEGDFSKVEIEMAREMVFTEITLGSQRLRTETAGVVACSKVATFRELLKNK
jgi:16S rRNA (uracil1498-N3)-methyltransferase